MYMRNDIDQQKEQIIEWLHQGIPRFEIARRLQCKYDSLKSRIDKWGLQKIKNPHRKGMKHLELRQDAQTYSQSKCVKSHVLKIKLIEDQIKKHQCEICLLTQWNNKLIPLELHHINGNHWDNKIDNLQILCPNCHAQTDNNSGKSIKNKAEVAQLAEAMVLGAIK